MYRHITPRPRRCVHAIALEPPSTHPPSPTRPPLTPLDTVTAHTPPPWVTPYHAHHRCSDAVYRFVRRKRHRRRQRRRRRAEGRSRQPIGHRSELAAAMEPKPHAVAPVPRANHGGNAIPDIVHRHGWPDVPRLAHGALLHVDVSHHPVPWCVPRHRAQCAPSNVTIGWRGHRGWARCPALTLRWHAA